MELYDPPSSAVLVVATTAITGGVTNQLLYDNAGKIGEITKANSSVLVTDGSGVPSWSTTLPANLVLTTPTITQVNSGAASVDMVLNVANAGQEMVLARTGTAFIRGNPFFFYPQSANAMGIGQSGNEWSAVWSNTLKLVADRSIAFTNQTSSAGAQLGTLTNAPAAGNPGFWAKISIGGVSYSFPCWAG